MSVLDESGRDLQETIKISKDNVAELELERNTVLESEELRHMYLPAIG